MPQMPSTYEVPIEKLRWRLDPSEMTFDTTEDLQPLKEIVGQKRGVEAFRFGVDIDKPGYNVFVTGVAGSGRKATVKRLLEEMSQKDHVPEDLCYVNRFANPEFPVLLRLPGGMGTVFKNEVKRMVNRLKKDIPEILESEEHLNAKKAVMEAFEKKAADMFKTFDQEVKAEGFAVVDVQTGSSKRPEVRPVVNDQPVPLDQIEALVEKGEFAKADYEALKKKLTEINKRVDQMFLKMRDLQKEVKTQLEDMDRRTVINAGKEMAEAIYTRYQNPRIQKYLEDMLEDMADNIRIFVVQPSAQKQAAGPQGGVPEIDPFQPYTVNLLVDNRRTKGQPVIIEEYPTYGNIFGSIERVVDRTGVWRTDFSKIKAGSLLRANGGYLVINVRDAIVEPGVWPALKRALKSKRLEIQSFDPMYAVATSGLKPEPINLDVKVVLISDAYLYQSLLAADEDLKKIFKVRADFDTVMEKNDEHIQQFFQFIKMATDEEKLRPFDRSAVAALIEQAVRMTGRQEKISTSFPAITDVIREADFWAGQERQKVVSEVHVDKAIDAKIYRSNLTEERLQEMINRGTIKIDTTGAVVGQVNGLAVYATGDAVFGKPSRITASTAMGRAGFINIEREAKLSGSTHDKGVLILGGYLRHQYAQRKPLTISASIAFEQAYSGVDGDSASSTEIYALLSSLADVPIRQDIAVTGSVDQQGRVQAIGGVNHKIEGFFDCCRQDGLTGDQGVMIPLSNVKDLMLRKDVVAAVDKGQFKIYAVESIDQGIEILTGTPAGQIGPDGRYPQGSINFLVDRKLTQLAEGLKEFGGGNSDKPGIASDYCDDCH